MAEDRIALFDMDGTIADHDLGITNSLRERGYDVSISIFDRNFPKELRKIAKQSRLRKGWWENLPPIESGLEIMKLCKDIGFRIGVLTQGPREPESAWGEKFAWCKRYVAPIDSRFIMNVVRNMDDSDESHIEAKGLVYGRVFVDDYPPYMNAWLENRPRGLGLMPLNKSNDSYLHQRVVKYISSSGKWRTDELVKSLEMAFSRKPFEVFR